MKNMVMMLMVIVLLVVGVGAFAEEYAMVAIVVNVDYSTDVVDVVDANENIWQFDGCEDWAVDDLCACLMDDNGTEIIYDDMIISCRYCGTIDNFIF